MTKQILSITKISVLALIISFGASYALAWAPPTSNPPGNNVAAPINVGATSQNKTGGLTAGSFTTTGLTTTGTLKVTTGAGAAKVLTSDASGNATWQTATGAADNLGNHTATQALNMNGQRINQVAGIDTVRQVVSALQNNTTLGGGLFQNSGDGLYNAAGTALALSGWWHVINMHHGDNNGYNAQMAVPLSASPNDVFFRTSNGGTWTEWRKMLSENTAGNVGIGTTAPGAKLDVVGDEQISGGAGTLWNGWNKALTFSNPAHAAISYPAGGLLFGMHSNTNFYWANTTAGIYTMTLGNTGNLGVPGTMRAGNGLYSDNGLTVGNGGGLYSFIGMQDSDQATGGSKYVHANSNVIGFLNNGGVSWLSYWDNVGNQQNTGNISANDVYIRASGKWASSLDRTPLASVDTNGNWAWTNVVNNHAYYSNGTTFSGAISLDLSRPVLGIRISGATNFYGGTCVVGVPSYFTGAVENSGGTVTDLDITGNWYTWTDSYAQTTTMPTTQWFFGDVPSGRFGILSYPTAHGAQAVYNKPAGLNAIPPAKSLWYGQYSYPGSTSYCSVDVMYGDYY